MPRVLITDSLSQAGIDLLNAAGGIEVVSKSGLSVDELREELKQADGIIVRSGTKLTPEVLEGQTRLKAVARAGVGVDNIDLPAATKAGVVVMNTPSGNTVSTAEQTLALMFALSRNTAPAAQSMAEGRWDRKQYTGTQLAGKTLGVVGLGRIGQAVARRCVALEMDVIGYDPFLSADRAKELGVELVRDVDQMIDRVDYLTVHTPLTDETRGLIGAARLAKMKPTARLVNCARGGIIDEAALAEALKNGTVAGAALDVYSEEPPPADSPLRDAPNLLMTPHLGASTAEAQESVAVEAAEIMANFLGTGEIRHAVNMVPVSGRRDGGGPAVPGPRLPARRAALADHRERGVNSVRLDFRGDAAKKKTGLVTGAFAAGLLADAVEDVNLVNAASVARDRGITLEESRSDAAGDFSTSVQATVTTDAGDRTAGGTLFGQGYLRLIRLDGFHLDAFLDGTLLIYRHRDVPGLIGFIGTLLGREGVNIADMSLGRAGDAAGGDSVAVLHLDSPPSDAALAEIAAHDDVTACGPSPSPPAGPNCPACWPGPDVNGDAPHSVTDPPFAPNGGGGFDDGFAAPRPRPGGGCRTVALLLGGGGLLAVLCCGGLGAVGWLGLGVIEQEVLDDLAGNPVLNEVLGGLTDAEIDATASAIEDGEDTFVFTLTGPDGSGRAVLDLADRPGGGTEVVSGTLRLPDGTTYDLFLPPDPIPPPGR